jgi:branched-chain amino acid aminotransferase
LGALPEKLGFGQYFTDHVFSMRYSVKQGWHDPRLEPYRPLSLDPSAAVLHYGQTIFEGGKAFRREDGEILLFRPEFHAERFARSAERVCLPAVPPAVFCEAVERLVDLERQWVPRQEQASLYLRPLLIGTEGFLGVRPSQEALFLVIASPVGDYYSGGRKPVRIWVEREHSRAAPGGIGAAKTGANYAASLYAARSAKERGFDQVLWTDACSHEFVEEVGTMNVFFRMGDEIVTPELNGSILGGATRESALTLLRSWGAKVTERPLRVAELEAAAGRGELLEAFGTGTAAVISSIGSIEGRDGAREFRIRPTGVQGVSWAERLYEAITGLQRGKLPDPHGWTRLVRAFSKDR